MTELRLINPIIVRIAPNMEIDFAKIYEDPSDEEIESFKLELVSASNSDEHKLLV